MQIMLETLQDKYEGILRKIYSKILRNQVIEVASAFTVVVQLFSICFNLIDEIFARTQV